MPVYKRIGRMFHCSPDQIKRIVQQKDSILKAWEQRTRRCQDAKTLEMKVVRVSMLGKAVYDWIRRMMYYKDFMITDGLIQKMALQFKSAMGLQNFFPHQDWCDKFRQTYKINENDSRILNIGYTQGHSVQIKDIIKDVLSECTPDLLSGETTQIIMSAEREDELLAPTPAKQQKFVLKPQKHYMMNNHRAVRSDTNVVSDIQDKITTTTTTITTTTTTTTIAAANTVVSTATSIAGKTTITTNGNTNNALRQLKLPQLVTLRRGIGSMTQKILVATPITTNANGQMNGTKSASSPMTMTIIPLATITQPMGEATVAGSAAQMPVGGSLIAAATKRTVPRIVPTPILEIKHEIKEEQNIDDDSFTQTNLVDKTNNGDGDVATIKQEILSDDDGEEENNDVSVDVNDMSTKVIKLQERNNEELKTATVGVTNNATAGDDTMDSTDYDNLALSSLRKIIKSKAALIKTTNAAEMTSETCAIITTTTPTITTTTTNIKSAPTLTLKPIENLRATSLPLPLPLPLPPMVSLSQLARVPTQMQAAKTIKATNVIASSANLSHRHITLISRATSAHLPPMPPLALQQLPPLTKAPSSTITNNGQLQPLSINHQHQTLPALIPRSSASGGGFMPPSSPSIALAYRLAPKHKLRAQSSDANNNNNNNLPAIRSCSEARRYLKLLEDYALLRENYRLIGLITRADEVLRELDGDDDVDID